MGGLRDVWIRPRQGAVRRVVERWWRRWAVLIVLPAVIVSSARIFGARRVGDEREGRGGRRGAWLTGFYRWWLGVRCRSLNIRFRKAMIRVYLRMGVLETDIVLRDMEMRGYRSTFGSSCLCIMGFIT